MTPGAAASEDQRTRGTGVRIAPIWRPCRGGPAAAFALTVEHRNHVSEDGRDCVEIDSEPAAAFHCTPLNYGRKGAEIRVPDSKCGTDITRADPVPSLLFFSFH